MVIWDSRLYRRYDAERTRPAIDLAARVSVNAPAHVVDLGCGPGNSTRVLADRWPGASLTGLDSSTQMLAAARADHPGWRWVEADIATWSPAVPFDVVFSNAALQWVGDHDVVFPRLLRQVASGGALAVQMPANYDAPVHRAIRELASSGAWRHSFAHVARDWFVHAPQAYYDFLAPHASTVDIWTTEYLHVLDGIDAVVDWYQGTGLRPWLQALARDGDRAGFLADFRAAVAPHFPERHDGRVLFPFKRLFVVAYR
ncbi:MAG: trans-aconitate 2-methyltransferase [Vicinamibacterales bacterium]